MKRMLSPRPIMWWILGLLFLITPVAWAEVDVTAEHTSLASQVDYIEDTHHTLTLETILADTTALPWQRHLGEHINFRFTSSAYWFRVTLSNPTPDAVLRVFEIAYPLLDVVDIVLVRSNSLLHSEQQQSQQHQSERQHQIIKRLKTGDHIEFRQRVIKNRYQVVEFEFPGHSQSTLYVRVASTSGMQVPMTLWTPQAFDEHYNLTMLGHGFFFGALIIIAAYNLFLWFSIRGVIYLYYVAFMFFFALAMGSLEGFGYQFLWPDMPQWNDRSVAVFLCVTLFFTFLFARSFLHLPRFNPILNKISLILMALVVLVFFVTLFAPYRIAISVVMLISTASSIIFILCGVMNYRAGNRAARYFTFSWLMLIVCNLIYGMGHLALLPRNFFVGNALQIGQILDALLLSFALADRINLLRNEKNIALKHAADTEKKAFHILKEANQQLEKALALADEDRRKKNRFIMTISHELRTPLNAISASVDQMRDAKTPEDRQYLQAFIKSGADRLATQIENLLILAETAQTAIKPQIRLFYVEQLLRQTIRVTEAYLFSKPVTFTMTVDNPHFAAYHGDDFLLLRIIVPVLENACKYTEKGGVHLHVLLSPEAIDFTIKDTGPGIDAAHQSAIFESFKQVSEGYQRSHEGLGIGLASSKSVAETLGARITLESEVGKGSCFYIHVPVKFAPEAPPLQSQTLTGKVLIVEDNVVNAKVLNALVRKLGLLTELAENGEIAVQKIDHESFDLILMDLQMPVMDGFNATLAMREKGVHCPIIAVTANSNYSARVRCLEVGMDDIVAKPLHKELLKEKLSLWMKTAK